MFKIKPHFFWLETRVFDDNTKHEVYERQNDLYTICGICKAFEGLVGKAYAKAETPATKLALPEGTAFESVATGTARKADYEIVYIYGRKYIIFSSGEDMEVLELYGEFL